MSAQKFDEFGDPIDDAGNEDFAALLDESMGERKKLEIGQKTDAKILQIGTDWIFLDVGQKGEGVLAVKELEDAEGNLSAGVGETISAYFMSRAGGELRFTTHIGSGISGAAQLEDAWRSGIPVDGRVAQEIKGGYEVTLPGNQRAFCPYSQISLRRPDSPESFIGTTLPFKISQFDEQGRNIVVSRRELLEEERRQLRDQLKETLKVGDRVNGRVTTLRDFGAFVDIGGIEGLLPISELAYNRVEDIHEVLKVGQQLELAVKKLDWDENRFSFSLRDTLTDPWSQVAVNFPVGKTVSGRVSRLTEFGAFITLNEGVDGLLHISKLGQGRHINHPRELLKLGEQIGVTVEKLDTEARRISLILAGQEAHIEETSYKDTPLSNHGMGTLGELLKASEEKKKHKKN